ncbi:MAG TPA: metallophosphoesterase [Myxococcales bacterium]|jgi:hypothetical protein
MTHRWTVPAILLPLVLAAACLTTGNPPRPAPLGDGASRCPPTPFSRDWSRDPAIVEIPDPQAPLYAVGDVHGTLPELRELLVRAGLIRESEAGDFEWIGGKAVLVQTGDLINKGPHSLAAIEFAIALESKAAAQGGRAVFLAGNHEIGFLAKAPQKWYAPIADEARSRGLDVCADVHSARTSFGQWLRTRPAAAVIGGIYFSHSGNSQGLTRAQIARFYRELVDTGDFGSRRGCGDPGAGPPLPGFFNADVWWGPAGSRLDGWLAALGVRQAAFGNDPEAFLAKGQLVGTFHSEAGRALFKLDVGTAYGDSRGALLRCTEFLPGGGCARPERLVNPAKAGAGSAAFEPVPLSAQPPAQDQPPPHAWGC